jgi:hypothetical protein
MTVQTSKLQTVADQIAKLRGVTDVRVWTKVAGKERVYIETTKHNGGRNWNGGVGFTTCYVEATTGKLVVWGEAGAATRKYHDENGTWDSIREIVKSASE